MRKLALLAQGKQLYNIAAPGIESGFRGYELIIGNRENH